MFIGEKTTMKIKKKLLFILINDRIFEKKKYCINKQNHIDDTK